MKKTTEASETTTFSSLGLPAPLLQALTEAGYEHPTPVQQQTIPLLLAGQDVVGQAQTGTGKTAAFSLPLLTRLQPGKKTVQALVLAPTRELAVQVAKAITVYATHMPQVSVVALYGGDSIQKQAARLHRGVHVVVATPGRLMDHVRRKSLSLDHVSMLVLDEADEMLRMGFVEDVTWVLEQVPASRQVALFSATMTPVVQSIAKKYLQDPAEVRVRQATVTKASIDQRYILVPEAGKWDLLLRLFETQSMASTLVFSRTKVGAAALSDRLEKQGIPAQSLHSDLSQAQRQAVLQRLRDKKLSVVVATDVAARGLDIHHISHVINYDMPQDAETYVHRIGRTGRVGASGTAVLFVTPREKRALREIEQYTKQTVTPMPVPGLETVQQQREDRLRASVQRTLESQDLAPYLRLVSAWVEDGLADAPTLAAAALRMAQGDHPLREAPQHDSLHALIDNVAEKYRQEERPQRARGRFRGSERPAGGRPFRGNAAGPRRPGKSRPPAGRPGGPHRPTR